MIGREERYFSESDLISDQADHQGLDQSEVLWSLIGLPSSIMGIPNHVNHMIFSFQYSNLPFIKIYQKGQRCI